MTAQFDSFAERYDETLRHWLDYKGPEIVHRAAMAALGPFPRLQEIIDLGCGTGLNAPLFAGIAARLDGIDLSPRMIEKARAGGRYDELIVGEIVEFLSAKKAAYTLALAADVLVYFGDLARSVRGGGCGAEAGRAVRGDGGGGERRAVQAADVRAIRA